MAAYKDSSRKGGGLRLVLGRRCGASTVADGCVKRREQWDRFQHVCFDPTASRGCALRCLDPIHYAYPQHEGVSRRGLGLKLRQT